jgi:hypothetical protein
LFIVNDDILRTCVIKKKKVTVHRCLKSEVWAPKTPDYH